DKACAGDAELRGEVEKLIASFENAGSFMESPAAAEVASMFEDKRTLVAHQTTGEMKNGKFVAGTVLANRYRIIGLLGKGGMGEVFKAEDIKLNQIVALKFLPDKLEKDKAALERFHAEVRTARQVSHPNVCRVFDIGEIENRHFLSMEFIDGDDLSSLLRRIGRLPSDKAIEISRQLCFGLAAIHEAGILHRDLKPANVIIDSRGKARITDFGIAGIESELTGGEIRIGTPAYMSPEQITGKEVSQKSDIYALGLVLYEIFTGKQTFQAGSINDLLQKQQTTAPTSPSEVLKEINPLVEKTILRCLEKNPSERPKNALQAAMMLPGGNPLEAAIAAGETPSPAMVAAAPKKGALKPAVAAGLLACIFVLIVVLTLMSKQSHLHRQVPLEKSPEVLRERSRELAEKYHYPYFDAQSGFSRETKYLDYVRNNDRSPLRWQKLTSGQPAVLQFSYRQSPETLVPSSGFSFSENDPPNVLPGMVELRLDTRSRLIFFDGVPPQTDDAGAATKNFDWAEVFREAGFNLPDFQETESKWTPPRAFDERKAWTGVYPEQKDIAIRVEAAAYRGRLVYFQIVEPWDKPTGEISVRGSAADASDIVLISIFFGILTVSALFAVRNVRMGRSDLRGAFRITGFLFFLRMLLWAFAVHHVPTLDEVYLLITGLQVSLFWSCFAGMMYLAFEPYLRKHTPERVISWNRLLAGDFRDPLVGRDILTGIFAGIIAISLFVLRAYVPVWFGNPPITPFFMSNPYGMTLAGIRGFPVLFLSQVTSSPVQAFMMSFLVLFFTLLLRRRWLGIAASWLLLFAFSLSQDIVTGVPLSGMTFALVFPTLMVLMTARFGVLAMMSTFLTYHLVVFYPITTELSAWYAGDFLLCAGFLLGLAIYGFYISLAGQKIFEAKFLKEVE
ncbi:MAG: serine/threonine-protein kinase, partial [Pyrinomonadaceae bacterium]